MAYKLIQNLTKVNYTKGNNGRKYIVIHYTGNWWDKSVNNGNYFKSTNRGASAHYFVDTENVVQVVSDSDTAWAVGRNYGSNNLFGKCTNSNSISIEMCSTDGKISDGTYRNTVELTKTLMKKYNIDAAHVVRHWDVCSKSCPGWTGWGANGCDSSIWNQFKKDITNKISVGWKKDNIGWWYRNDDESYPKEQWKCLDNVWYYFDKNGYAINNKWESINGHWYYFNDDCSMKTGWLCDNGDWYYLSESNTPYYAIGAMVTGWRKIDGFWYLLRTSGGKNHQTGSAVLGEYNDGTNDYYFVSSGEVSGFPGCSMVTGWLKKNNKWYWYNKDKDCIPVGAMMRNHWVTDKGTKYYLKDDGSMACNEIIKIGGKEYSFNSSGALK
jgi:glucan-binding YG repeat protein|nr:MAG TPA: N-acetylmuramoyl-L-alanine amidase [Caudoviricetes sp.]